MEGSVGVDSRAVQPVPGAIRGMDGGDDLADLRGADCAVEQGERCADPSFVGERRDEGAAPIEDDSLEGHGVGLSQCETAPMDAEQCHFVELVLCNPVNRVVLERGMQLGVPDWWRPRARCSRRCGTFSMSGIHGRA